MKLHRRAVFRQVKPYVRQNRWSVVLVVAVGCLSVPLALVSPKLFQLLVDQVMVQGRLDRLAPVAAGLLGAYGLRLLLDGAGLYAGNRLLNRFTYTLRTRIWEKYTRLSYSSFLEKEAGDWKLRMMEDVDCLGSFIKDQVADYVYNLLLVGVTLAAALWIHPLLTALCLLALPLVFGVNRWLGTGTGRVNEETRRVTEEYAASTHSSLQFWKEIKAQGAEERFIARFNAYRDRLAELGYRWARYWGFQEVFNDFKANYLTKVMVYVIGAFFVIDGRLTVGTLLMFAEYFALLFTGLDAVNSKNAALRANGPYYRRAFETLSLPEQPEGAAHPVLSGRVEADRLCFGYTPDKPVLREVSLELEPGEYVAVVGPSGCGKTTLMKLLLGLYDPDRGQVRLDGTPLEALSREALYSQVGVVMQDSYLFDMSLRDNLRLGRPEASDEELLEACGRAGIRSFVEGLPRGLDTVVGERGVKLSGGQKQRLAIARALLTRPKLLIFDEATSALDRISETAVLESLRGLEGNTTLLVISHRPATVLRAGRVVVMREGRIVDSGTREELAARSPFYQALERAEGRTPGVL